MKKDKIFILGSDLSVIAPLKNSYDVEAVTSRSALSKKVSDASNSLVLIDADLEPNFMEAFREIGRASAGTRFMVISASISIPEAVEAVKNGIADVVKKPVLAEKLVESVKKNLHQDWLQFKIVPGPRTIWLSGGGRMTSMFSAIENALKSRKNIFFVTEPGIDVQSLAMAVHGSRTGEKLTSIDIASFERENAESIFWTVLQKALGESTGVYIDNIVTVSAKQQSSILEYVGSRATKGQVLMVNASTHEMGEASSRWEKVHLPAIRERKEDLPSLISAYLGRYCLKHGKEISSITLDALNMMVRYSWPGNYRELECVLESSVIAANDEVLGLDSLQLGSRMVAENIVSPQAENLLEFKNIIEKNLANILYSKTRSQDTVASVLDIPKARVAQKLSS